MVVDSSTACSMDTRQDYFHGLLLILLLTRQNSHHVTSTQTHFSRSRCIGFDPSHHSKPTNHQDALICDSQVVTDEWSVAHRLPVLTRITSTGLVVRMGAEQIDTRTNAVTKHAYASRHSH
jgi:hypothetical protein